MTVCTQNDINNIAVIGRKVCETITALYEAMEKSKEINVHIKIAIKSIDEETELYDVYRDLDADITQYHEDINNIKYEYCTLIRQLENVRSRLPTLLQKKK